MRIALPVLACLLAATARAAEAPVDYLRDVKPILRTRCASCHGALRQKSGLRLDTAAFIRKGGDRGPAVVGGKSGESLLVHAITGSHGMRRMPPRGQGEPLPEQQVAVLKAWIDQGAKAPDEPVPEDPRKHWAFQVPKRPAVPLVARASWVRNPIDAFVAQAHEQHGLRPSPPADRAVLLRRVYLDLTGLPPTREELHAFLADRSDDAYEKVVDRLLGSPQYGERWARHWMDVWRYSDWYGRRAVPDVWNSAPQIWRWRDWIVRSLNADRGYDRMVMEMLAADEVAPEDDEAQAATGYIVRNWYALNYNQWMRDLVEHTGKAFLGLTMNCCHCHDHKYDPISNEEYFRFRAFFEPLELRQDRVPGEPDPGPFQKYEYTVLRRVVQSGMIRVFDEKLDAKTYRYAMGDERNRLAGKPPVPPGAPAFLGGDPLAIEPVRLPATAYYPGLKPFIRNEEIARCEKALADARVNRDKARHGPAGPAVQLAEARLAAAEASLKSIRARVAADDARYKGGPGNAHELARAAARAERQAAVCAAREKLIAAEQNAADLKKKAAALPAGKPKDQAAAAASRGEQDVKKAGAALAAAALVAAKNTLDDSAAGYSPLTPIYPSTSTGRRRALALWLTGRSNPLTARVAVNHIWMRHFGKALVESVFDFGRNGKRPTHPELLDWLAVEFMDSGWSMKHLHRLIVTSNAYRMASGERDETVTGQSSDPLKRVTTSAVRSDRLQAVATPDPLKRVTTSAVGSDRLQAVSAPDPLKRVTTNRDIDPDNRWLWHFAPRRVEAEVVRDSILATTGELDRQVGGPVLDDNLAATSRRRSMYFAVYPEGDGHVKSLEMFDVPDPCDCYRRTESIVPQQAFVLTNSELALRQSRVLARKLTRELGPVAEQAFIVAAFEQVLARAPSAPELTVCADFLHRQAALFRTSGAQPPVNGKAALPPSADPVLRSRESLVRALFSHNDFVTIR